MHGANFSVHIYAEQNAMILVYEIHNQLFKILVVITFRDM